MLSKSAVSATTVVNFLICSSWFRFVSVLGLLEMTVIIAGSSVSKPLMPPPGIREMHRRLVLRYFVAWTEPFQSSVLKPGKAKSGLGALVSADNLGPVCVAWRKERRFE